MPDLYSNKERSIQQQSSSLSSQHTIVRRRSFLLRGVATATSTVLLCPTQSANAAITDGAISTNKNNNNDSPKPWNPLNLKGTFWETGKLYEKSNPPIMTMMIS